MNHLKTPIALMDGAFRVQWSPEDEMYVGTHPDWETLSHLHADAYVCLKGIQDLVRDVGTLTYPNSNWTGVQVDTLQPGLKDSGTRQEFSTGSVRDNGENKGHYDSLPMEALRRLAVVYELGAKKYATDNWRKGQPTRRIMQSALRHLMRYAEGWRDEDHLAQAMWNIAAIIETQTMITRGFLPAELDNLPNWVTPEKKEVK